MFLAGEAGIGKSRLAQVSAEEAEQHGLRVLRGRAVQTATPVAYRPLAEALSSAVRAGAEPDAESLAPFRSTLGRLIPSWRDADRPGADDSVLALAEGVLRFLRAVASEAGCLLWIEDLHWADPETLVVVEYLADNLAGERVLCVVTVRDESPSQGYDLACRLHARRVSALIDLPRLDDGDVALMVESCLDTEVASPEIIALAARADGVPFLVEELLAVAVTAGALVHNGVAWAVSRTADHVVPLTFADSVRRRLAAIGVDARAVLASAAILGRRFDWQLLPAITGVDEQGVVEALHAAVDAQLVAVDPAAGTFRFRHALSRDAVLAEMLPPERIPLSERALNAVERSNPGLPGAWCELAAELAERAGDRRRAAALLLEAGRRAMNAGALASADAILERARALSHRSEATTVDIEEALTTVLALAGNWDRAMAVGESLLLGLGHDPKLATRRAQAQLCLARAAVAATRWREADERLERAAAEAASVTDDSLRAHIEVVAAHVAILRRPEQAVSLAQSALDAAERFDLPEVACEALEIIGRFARSRDLDAAEAAFARAHDIAEAHGRAVWSMRALHELGTIELLRDGGITLLQQARELSVTLGAPAITAVVDVQIGATLSVRDDPEPAADVCRRAAAVARRYSLDQTLAAALAFEGVTHARAGRRAELERCLAEAVERGGGLPEVGFNAAFARAHLAFVNEDRRAAIHALGQYAAVAADAVGVQTTGPNPALLALLLAVEGDAAAVSRWLSQPPVHFLARGWGRYAEAVLAGRASHGATATQLVMRGDEELEGFNWYREYGRRLVAEAAITDGWGDPARWLLDALAFFDRRGETRIASACRSLLRRAGVPVPRRRGEAATQPSLRAFGVTAREAEVLDLLGQGLSNRDVGVRLYMSPRTVERHVASLTAKVGVSRRSQLMALAAQAAADAVEP